MADNIELIVANNNGNYIGNNPNAIMFPVSSDYTLNDYRVVASTKAVYSALADFRAEVSGYTKRIMNIESVVGLKHDNSGESNDSDVEFPKSVGVAEALTVGGSAVVTDVYPSVNGTYSLGTTGRKWNNIYSNNATIDTITSTSISVKNTATISSIKGTSITLSGTATAKSLVSTSITAKGDITVAGNIVSTGTITASGLSVGDSSKTTETQVLSQASAGSIYLYSQGTNTGDKGLYAINASGTGIRIVTINQSNVASFNGNITGLASTATKLATARNINIKDADGTNTGTAISFDGTKAITIALPSTIKANITGSVTGNVTGTATASTKCTGTAAYATSADSASTANTATYTSGTAVYATNAANASIATKLETARSIFGNSFDGTADIKNSVTNIYRIEFDSVPETANHGGYIDFHFNGSTANYTSRIIESESGTLTVKGNLTANKVMNAYYNDYAEFFPRGEETEPGDIIMLDEKNMEEKYIKASSNSFSPIVIGVHSDTYGHIVGGEDTTEEENLKNFIPVGLTGRLWVKVTGVVSLGDYIVPSSKPGVGKSWDLETDPCETIVGRVVFIDKDKVPTNKNEVYKVKILIRH